MKIRQNLHIHSRHSCDSGCAALNDVQGEMLKLGIKEFGVSDHLHTQYNRGDMEASREDFFSVERSERFHFGIEVSVMSCWECEKIAAGDYEVTDTDPVYGLRSVSGPAGDPACIAITAEDIEQLKIQYVIGGVHWTLYPPPEREAIYHDLFRQMMFLVENPLVDIIAHPWSGLAGCFKKLNNGKPDFLAMLEIPQKYNDQLQDALLKNDTCAELNLSVLTYKGYPPECLDHLWRILTRWREAGVKFTIGSDQHSLHADEEMFAAAEKLLDTYGFTEENIRFFFD